VTNAGELVEEGEGDGPTSVVGVAAGVAVGVTTADVVGVGRADCGLMMSQPPAARRQQSKKTMAELRVMAHPLATPVRFVMDETRARRRWCWSVAR
jgi:hypothetical protein